MGQYLLALPLPVSMPMLEQAKASSECIELRDACLKILQRRCAHPLVRGVVLYCIMPYHAMPCHAESAALCRAIVSRPRLILILILIFNAIQSNPIQSNSTHHVCAYIKIFNPETLDPSNTTLQTQHPRLKTQDSRFEYHRNASEDLASTGVGAVVTTVILGSLSSAGNCGSCGALLSTGLV